MKKYGEEMPKKAKSPCRYSGCPNLTDDSSGYCDKHKSLAPKRYFRNYKHTERYGYQWRKIRAFFLSENPLCEMCKREGRYTDATEIHHVVPLSEGGTNDFENLMPLCKSCHSRITMKEINKGR